MGGSYPAYGTGPPRRDSPGGHPPYGRRLMPPGKTSPSWSDGSRTALPLQHHASPSPLPVGATLVVARYMRPCDQPPTVEAVREPPFPTPTSFPPLRYPRAEPAPVKAGASWHEPGGMTSPSPIKASLVGAFPSVIPYRPPGDSKSPLPHVILIQRSGVEESRASRHNPCHSPSTSPCPRGCGDPSPSPHLPSSRPSSSPSPVIQAPSCYSRAEPAPRIAGSRTALPLQHHAASSPLPVGATLGACFKSLRASVRGKRA